MQWDSGYDWVEIVLFVMFIPSVVAMLVVMLRADLEAWFAFTVMVVVAMAVFLAYPHHRHGERTDNLRDAAAQAILDDYIEAHESFEYEGLTTVSGTHAFFTLVHPQCPWEVDVTFDEAGEVTGFYVSESNRLGEFQGPDDEPSTTVSNPDQNVPFDPANPGAAFERCAA